MDGAGRAFGCPVDVRLFGGEYTVQPLTLFCLGRCEQRMLFGRQMPLESAIEIARKLPKNSRERILRDAWQETHRDKRSNKISGEELFAWLDSPAGMLYSARLCLRTWNDRKISPSKIESLFINAERDDIVDYRRAREIASGLGLLGNLDWRFTSDGMEDSLYPWRSLLRNFASQGQSEKTLMGMGSAPGWDYRTVGGMTLYQLKAYTCDSLQFEQTADLGDEATKTLVNRIREEKEKRDKALQELIKSYD